MSSKVVALKVECNKYGLNKNDIGILKSSNDESCSVYFIRLREVVELELSDVAIIDPKKFGDLENEKICNVCHRILPTFSFDLNQSGKGDRPVRRPSCKDCRKGIDGVGMSPAEKKRWMKSKPVLVDFECPICLKVTIPGLTSKVVLNHDHATGKIYGWICDSCNTGLGRFKDDVEVLNQAINYLKTPTTSNPD
jgi:hypothetical protein